MMADFPEPRTRAGEDWTAPAGPGAWSPHQIQPRTGHGVVNQAKGAVMLQYGVDSPIALALLVRWSRRAGSNLERSAQSLVSDLRGSSSNGRDSAALARWIELELDGAIPDDS